MRIMRLDNLEMPVLLSVLMPNQSHINANKIFYVSLVIGERSMNAKLIALSLSEFDVILGMNWLSKYHVAIDYYKM